MAKKEKKGKGILGKALDSVTSRDEKEALEEAKKETQEAEARAKEAEAKAKELEAELKEKSKKEKEDAIRQKLEESRAARKPKAVAEHKVAADETLGQIAQKYYKHATKPYYMLIYEANKDVIGDNPNRIKVGMVLNIPELPENMK